MIGPQPRRGLGKLRSGLFEGDGLDCVVQALQVGGGEVGDIAGVLNSFSVNRKRREAFGRGFTGIFNALIHFSHCSGF